MLTTFLVIFILTTELNLDIQQKNHLLILGNLGEPVLDHVSVRNKISDNEDNKRKWTFMISDGVPYIYASILQDTYVTCSICNEEVSSHQLPEDEFETLKKEHSASHENEKCFFMIYLLTLYFFQVLGILS